MIKKGELYYPTKEFQNKAWLKDKKIYSEANKNPILFWEKLAKELFWRKKWQKAFEHKPPFFKWFLGGKLNITENIFERNKLGWEKIKNKTALIWEPEPVSENTRKITYGELFSAVCKFTNALRKLGVKKGDRVGIYLPMIPEVIISMLACARIGAVHTVVFSAFSSHALQTRLQDTEAKVLITADGYYRRGKVINLKQQADEAVFNTKVEKIIVVKRAKNKITFKEGRDLWFEDITRAENDECRAGVIDSEDPLFILYTSGSTGKPKGILHTCGGYMVQSYWTGKWIFDWHEDDIFWCVPSGSLVTTNPGVKEIQNIKIGDKVLTHQGRYMPVERTFVREYKGELIKLLTSYSNTPVELTPNHKVLVLRKRMPLITEWVKAEDLKVGDYVAFPRIIKELEKKIIKISDILKERKVKGDYLFPKKGKIGKIKNEVKIDNNFFRLSGYYIAEGSIARDTIQLTFSGKEREFAEDSLNLFKQVFGVKARILKYKGSWETRADSIILAEFFAQLFGHSAFTKHLPHWILTLKKDLLWEFINGYWRGDGATDLKRRRRIRITTVSKILAYQIKLILNKLSIVTSMTYLPAERVRKRQEGRKIQSARDSYELAITGKSAQKFYTRFNLKEPKDTYTWQRAIITTNLIFFPLKKKEVSSYDGLVWNLKTKHNSYTLNNLVVHNCTADIGWITSHTYNCYANLLNGITFAIFEGAPDWPEPDRWAQIIEKHKVTIFYTAPTAIRMFEKLTGRISEKFGFKTLRLLGSVGEPIDEDAWQWYFKNIGKERCPIVDTWWQTETGGILITSLPGLGPFKPAFTGIPFPGVKIGIREGNLVILRPFAPGMLRGIYKDPKKYTETYWSQYGKSVYFTSDGAYRDKAGLVRILGRVDDVMKVAGHRLTTGELEAAVNLHPDITECAVIGIPDEIKGEAPLVFIVSREKAEKLKTEALQLIRKEIGPIARPKSIYVVDDLPKTRSGKIMRRILKKIFTGEELGDLSTLANPESVQKIKEEVQRSQGGFIILVLNVLFIAAGVITIILGLIDNADILAQISSLFQR